MTLPKDVADAVELGDQFAGTYEHGFAVKNAWATVRAHLLSQDAEIDRLRGIVPELAPRPPDGNGMPRYGLRWNGPELPLSIPMADGYWTPWHLAESRLAAADALLRDIRAWDVDCALDTKRDALRPLFMLPIALRQRIQAHLQGAGDEA